MTDLIRSESVDYLWSFQFTVLYSGQYIRKQWQQPQTHCSQRQSKSRYMKNKQQPCGTYTRCLAAARAQETNHKPQFS